MAGPLRELHATCDRLHGADIAFPFPSVGATENIVTAAVFANGTTTIDNAAREPEVVDLCDMLVKMGADIHGIGSSRLVINGVDRGSLSATGHRTVADRIQAATYLAAVAVAKAVFSRVSFDLIYARPGQSRAAWRACRAAGDPYI